jgi:outer membrane lipoprotein-sorting protein
MSAIRRLALAAGSSPALLLAGCSLLPTTRHLPVPKAPAQIQTVTPDQLVDRVNQRWGTLQTLTVKVQIQASTEKPQEGLERTMPSFPAVILLRKPEMLRVYGLAPVIGIPLFDMASDGKNFTLYIPSKKEAVKGPNSLTKKSPNQLENMRPGFFFDAMTVRGLDAGDDYAVTADSETMEDPSKKHLLITPEYILNVMHRKPDSHEMKSVRVITFNRDDMLPHQQDIYDNDGNLETQVFYADYRDFGPVNYPSIITIKRPMESYQIVLAVQTVNENQTLKDDQFVAKVPAGTPVKNLE